MPDVYPLQVEINEENILKITSTFKSAYKDIVDEIVGATNFGVANRKAILKQIEAILAELGTDVESFLETELPKYYKTGADDAVVQLRNAGVDVSVSEGFNRIHKDAIVALVDDTAEAFGESLTGVARSARLLLGKAVREAITARIATSIISGDALRDIKLMIVGLLQQQGLDALIDRGGHKWTLDRYAEMLFRTKAVEARNRGLANRMVENGYDLVQVSNHNTDHEACRVWEGKILSISGESEGYPTVAEAEIAGLFHPNAVLSGTTFFPYGELDEMIGADYKGPAITVHTAQGHNLTIGPNHPVLTQRGLVKASLLTKNDYLVYDTRVNTTQFSGDSYFKQMPLVEDIFQAFLFSGRSISIIPTASHNFHGDIIFCEGKVQVIKPAISLLPIFDSGRIEQFRDSGLMGTNMEAIIASSDRPSDFTFDAVNLASPSGMGGGLSSYKFVHIDSLHNIRFIGKAYDAQTGVGLYNSNGFVVSNCKHAINTLIPSLAAKTRAYDSTSKTLSGPGRSVIEPFSKQIEPLAQKAEAYDLKFKEQIGKIAKETGLDLQNGKSKTTERAAQKILSDYNGKISDMRDWNRSVFFIDDPAKLDAFTQAVKKEFPIDRIKNNFDSTQDEYKKAIINVKTPNGLTAEVQVTTPEMWRAKKVLGGDDLYHKIRTEAPGWEELKIEMEQLYREADVMTTARLNAS